MADFEQCEIFKVTAYLESKLDFDLTNDVRLICPYDVIPENINIPGYLHYSTNHSMNIFSKYLVEKRKKSVIFDLKFKSVFNIYLPDEHSPYLSNIKLYKMSNGTKTLIIQLKEKQGNSMNVILPIGNYRLSFKFAVKSNEEAHILSTSEVLCSFYELSLSIYPAKVYPNSQIPNEVDVSKEEFNCKQSINNDEASIPSLKPNGIFEFYDLKINNKPIEDKYINDNLLINVESQSIRRGQVVGELNFNPALDPWPVVRVFKVPNRNIEEDETDEINRAENEDDLDEDDMKMFFNYKKQENEIIIEPELY